MIFLPRAFKHIGLKQLDVRIQDFMRRSVACDGDPPGYYCSSRVSCRNDYKTIDHHEIESIVAYSAVKYIHRTVLLSA
jgi:hypothetical protein